MYHLFPPARSCTTALPFWCGSLEIPVSNTHAGAGAKPWVHSERSAPSDPTAADLTDVGTQLQTPSTRGFLLVSLSPKQ